MRQPQHDSFIVKAYDHWDDIRGISQDEELGLYQKSEEVCRRNLERKPVLSAIEVRFFKNSLGSVLNNSGIIYKQRGNYARAIDCYMESIRIREEISEQKRMAKTLNNVGTIYQLQGDFNKALEFYGKSLAIKVKEDDDPGIASTTLNIGNIYLKKADSARAKGDSSFALEQDKIALEHFERSKAIYERLGVMRGVALNLVNIGIVHSKSGDYESAIAAQDSCYKIGEKSGNKRLMASSLKFKGRYYLDLKKYSQAIDFSKRACDLSNEAGYIMIEKSAANILYKAYKQIGQHKKALEMYELYSVLKDSINKDENHRAVLRQEYQYEFDKQVLADSLEFVQREAVLQERSEKQVIGLLAAGIGLVLLIGLALAIYKGKKRSEELLLNILPKETAEELKQKGRSKARRIDHVTVLFTDFKGFTEFSEHESPEHLVEKINECFSAFDRIMEKYGVEKIKTIGDAYMAAGGIPIPNETHVIDVINAALEIQEFMQSWAEEKNAMGDRAFEIRIGVHSGPVVAGIVGIKKFQYDIWGDTVNTASRMESSGEVGEVNISAATYKFAKDVFDCEYRGKIHAKGKGEIDMYFVKGRKNTLV